jgi:sugar transferase (PEP-CTERM/EpsH1 system associated)
MNVLFLTHRLPFAPNRGDRVRAYHIIKMLARRGSVHVLSLVHDREEEAEADTLRRLGVGVTTARVRRARSLVRAAAGLPTARPLSHLLLDSAEMPAAIDRAVRACDPDVVLAYCSGMARFALEPPLDRLPLVLDFVDVDSAKWDDFAKVASPARRWLYRREARTLSAFEASAARRACAATVVTAREADALRRISPDAPVHVVANGVDAEHLAPIGAPGAAPEIVFTGVFNYGPNADGAIWFARHVWPLVRSAVPAAKLTLAGSSPRRDVQRLAAVDASIEVTGRVPDMRPYLWRSAIAIAPIFEARGVQNKVLEAAAAGLPAVITSAVRAGLPREMLRACRLADTPSDFAAAVIGLLALAPDARRAMAAEAHVQDLTWPRCLAPLGDLLATAAAGSTIPRRVAV